MYCPLHSVSFRREIHDLDSSSAGGRLSSGDANERLIILAMLEMCAVINTCLLTKFLVV